MDQRGDRVTKGKRESEGRGELKLNESSVGTGLGLFKFQLPVDNIIFRNSWAIHRYAK